MENAFKTKGLTVGNGLRNIEEHWARNKYSRLRIGVGSDFFEGSQADYVLGNFTESETAFLPEHLDRARNSTLYFVLHKSNDEQIQLVIVLLKEFSIFSQKIQSE